MPGDWTHVDPANPDRGAKPPRPSPIASMYARSRNPFGNRPRPSGGVLLLAILPALWGCGVGGVTEAAEEFGFDEVPSPAGEGSRYPQLALDGSDVIMSWLEPGDKPAFALRGARFSRGTWTANWTIAESDLFFVNWADFPSVVALADGTLAAHWLLRGGQGTYDYSVQVSFSPNGGDDWTPPRPAHEDGTPTEHGFVSLLPGQDSGLIAFWLDGRKSVLPADQDDDPETRGPNPAAEMTVRGRTLNPGGDWGPEELLDGRTCDCCQTAAARLADGRAILVYRDRSPDEVRDIYAVRGSEGAWEDPRPVARDGWVMPQCPVNGPAIAARGDTLAVAWFTAPGGVPRVSLAFSRDGGETWAPPITIDDQGPQGRVQVQLLPDGRAAVLWMGRAESGGGELRVRGVDASGALGPVTTLRAVSGTRADGFPRVASLGDGRYLVAWTDSNGERGGGTERVGVGVLEWKGGRDR
jgi:hypothetical protein